MAAKTLESKPATVVAPKPVTMTLAEPKAEVKLEAPRSAAYQAAIDSVLRAKKGIKSQLAEQKSVAKSDQQESESSAEQIAYNKLMNSIETGEIEEKNPYVRSLKKK